MYVGIGVYVKDLKEVRLKSNKNKRNNPAYAGFILSFVKHCDIIKHMRILGIDPGMAIVGYSLVEYQNDKYYLETSGSIQTDKSESDSERLLEIYNDLSQICKTLNPDCAAIEKLYFFKNQKTIIPVAEARGVILAVLEKYHIKPYEYTPIEVKQVLTGYGRATKKEVEQMVKITLEKDDLPKLDDTIDAIAIAICHRRNMINSQ